MVDQALVEQAVEAGSVTIWGGAKVEPDLSEQTIEFWHADLGGLSMRVKGSSGAPQNGCGHAGAVGVGERDEERGQPGLIFPGGQVEIQDGRNVRWDLAQECGQVVGCAGRGGAAQEPVRVQGGDEEFATAGAAGRGQGVGDSSCQRAASLQQRTVLVGGCMCEKVVHVVAEFRA